MNRMPRRPGARRLALATLAAALAATSLAGCAPLLLGGAMVGGAMVAIDRRTSGAQLEDEGIELKSLGRVRDVAPEAHVNVTSYNRTVLITGEVTKDAERSAVEQAVGRVANVHAVVNELAVMPVSALADRSRDTVLSARVKAAFVDAQDLQANAAKVVSERGVVYLMGRVTEREATRFAEAARGVAGVAKVVRVFEIISEEELASLQPAAPKK